MIERTVAFKIGDQSFLTLKDAQVHEMKQLVNTKNPPAGADEVVEWVFKNKDKIMDILTTTTTSKAKARSINGGKKPRNVNKSVKTQLAPVEVSLDVPGDPIPITPSEAEVEG